MSYTIQSPPVNILLSIIIAKISLSDINADEVLRIRYTCTSSNIFDIKKLKLISIKFNECRYFYPNRNW